MQSAGPRACSYLLTCHIVGMNGAWYRQICPSRSYKCSLFLLFRLVHTGINSDRKEPISSHVLVASSPLLDLVPGGEPLATTLARKEGWERLQVLPSASRCSHQPPGAPSSQLAGQFQLPPLSQPNCAHSLPIREAEAAQISFLVGPSFPFACCHDSIGDRVKCKNPREESRHDIIRDRLTVFAQEPHNQEATHRGETRKELRSAQL